MVLTAWWTDIQTLWPITNHLTLACIILNILIAATFSYFQTKMKNDCCNSSIIIFTFMIPNPEVQGQALTSTAYLMMWTFSRLPAGNDLFTHSWRFGISGANVKLVIPIWVQILMCDPHSGHMIRVVHKVEFLLLRERKVLLCFFNIQTFP